ncbi:zf-HC2 domain-containing protein [Streptomyces sp. NRRL S-340]|uniref:zf-HC2 domain-containing protein n=1 Tax=Streptomyces sp. NRRL S-340 TaxID=1463901 RepID=UPI000D19C62A|nr:zf-HC2 domain-containing protein [Streptomyces sp. NRRL S-340]
MSGSGGDQASGTGGPGAPGPVQGPPAPDEHETVGAYALGVLDDAEATAFEAHLTACERCARRLDELAGMEPVLAALAGTPRSGTGAIGESLPARPGPGPADRLVGEVARRRARTRRRNLFLAAAAAVLVVGGALTVHAVGGADGGGSAAVAVSTAQAAFRSMPDKVTATDPATHVTATVALEKKDWGTNAVLRLRNVTGPERCSLVAVGRNGERQTVTSWSVPDRGYGAPGARTEEAGKPLYVSGGAAFRPDQIDHFEVMTFDGHELVRVEA